jgi:hypothetical protein
MQKIIPEGSPPIEMYGGAKRDISYSRLCIILGLGILAAFILSMIFEK